MVRFQNRYDEKRTNYDKGKKGDSKNYKIEQHVKNNFQQITISTLNLRIHNLLEDCVSS